MYVSYSFVPSNCLLTVNRPSLHLQSLLIINMLFRQIVKLAAFASLAKAVELTGYEYVVVGSGAGKY